jgi:hypothetical protein
MKESKANIAQSKQSIKSTAENRSLKNSFPSSRSQNALKHGAAGFERDGRLPVEWDGFDRDLVHEMLILVGGDERFTLACTLAARRATLVELAFSWLAQEEVDVFWIEKDKTGRNIVMFQPVLTRLFGWMNGLRRDLSELNLTPAQSARHLPDESILDAGKILEMVRNEQSD